MNVRKFCESINNISDRYNIFFDYKEYITIKKNNKCLYAVYIYFQNIEYIDRNFINENVYVVHSLEQLYEIISFFTDNENNKYLLETYE